MQDGVVIKLVCLLKVFPRIQSYGSPSLTTGALNVLIPFTTLTGAMTCIWPFMGSSGGLIAVVMIYG